MGLIAAEDILIPEPEQVLRHVTKVLSSSIFSESPTQQKLLRYLVEKATDGHGPDLKEYTIGSEVFHRGPEFDPRIDSIVRVQVGVLRKKLAAYYDGPGQTDLVMITVPRGRYVPEIRMRESQVIPIAAAPAVPVHKQRSPWMLLATGVVLGIVCTALAVSLYPRGPAPIAKFEWRDHPVWKGFFDPRASTRLVVGVPFMLDVGGLLARDSLVNQPEDVAASKPLQLLAGSSNNTYRPIEIYTGVGEAEGISVLTRFFGLASKDLSLTRSRLTKWQDLADGNLVLVSSLRFRTLGTELDRPNDFQFVGIPKEHPALHNLHPQSGEALDYRSNIGADSGTDYALVTVWRGTMPGRRIMAIGGTHTWGTEGAAEYITDGPSLRELLEKTGPNYPAGKTGLQVLVKVDVRDSQVASTTYITHHWLQ